MSFALPSIKPKSDLPKDAGIPEGPYGVPDVMTYGFTSVKANLEASHPLYASEKNYKANRDNMNLVMLRNIQGLHAPLKISMELNAARKIGHLPFLPSSNVMLDSLTGKDLEIGAEDIFGIPEFWEVQGQPHAVCEKALGLL
ncbi:proteasome maturation protein [Agrilus planipennis]|uniref:Proteasome maturation protein n=1 Tax=Agrilus planipennis TaxID=224129 RepID=A0A1W4W516_AGRPL|nr:proteasome maturation protein [Agrilus planipennis]